MKAIPLYWSHVGKRQFTTAVRFKGEWVVSDVAGNPDAARKRLEAKLRKLGVKDMPPWDMVEVQRKAETEPEPASEPQPFDDAEPDTERHVPSWANGVEADILAELLDEDAESVEPAPEVDPLAAVLAGEDDAQDPDSGDAPTIPIRHVDVPHAAPKMDGSYVTPQSDKEAWIALYRDVCTKLADVEVPGETPREQKENFRRSVNELMESFSFIGPWRRTPGGDCWIRFAGCEDITVKAIKRGEGNRREIAHKDINGNWVSVASGGTELANGRVVRPRAYSGHPGDFRRAKAFGNTLKARAVEQGLDKRAQNTWFKLGTAAALRALGCEPHAVYEREIADAFGWASTDANQYRAAIAAAETFAQERRELRAA